MSEKILHRPPLNKLHFNPPGQVSKSIGEHFFRGENCNFNPYHADELNEAFCQQFILKGWLPDHPFIAADTRVTTFGSCFAQHIAQYLMELGFNLSKSREPDIYLSFLGEGLVNVYSLLQQFEWALEDIKPPENLWHGFKAETFGYDETIRQKTRDVFLNTDVFIVTFGLSEIWYDEVTGGVFWRAVPMNVYDPARHKFRVCTFAETKAAIARMFELIRRHAPKARTIFTISPIPLIATFRPVSCITANSASKAIIRAAIDEFLRESETELGRSLYYFPAYDMVSELFPCKYVEDGRHPYIFIVDAIMKIFEAFFCGTNLSKEEAERILRQARLKSAAVLRSHDFYKSSTAIAPG